MTKKFAFTLAEVLIALAIIGVVAAMTIPTFMANTAGSQFKTAFKKSVAVLTQAAAANYATDGYDFGTANGIYSGATSQQPIGDTKHGVFGFDTVSTPETDYVDTNNDPSLFHLFQNNLNLKNSSEITNYAVAGTPLELSCAGRGGTGDGVPLSTISYKKEGTTGTTSYTNSAAVGTRPKAGDLNSAGMTNMGKGGMRSLCAPSPVSANGASGGINQGRMFQMEDGAVFTYDPSQGYCTESNPCYGYLDVNGPTGPNRMVGCTTGSDGWINDYGRNANADMLLVDCTVESKDISDIFPVAFYNSTVKPASFAAKSVLYAKKSNQVSSGS